MANGFDPRSQFYRAQASQVAQKRQALNFAKQRQDAEEATKIKNVNTLSGFQASQIPDGPMREIYEERIRDAQAYMNGAGEYGGENYSALEAANKIAGLTTMFNKMSAHNMGAVAEAQAAYKKGAFEVADDRERINPYGDPSGNAVYSNNSPDGYRSRVQRHNNYFQWTGDYDANGDPIGYMLDDEGNPTGDPMSIFKMQGYANPASFESDTVIEDIPALVDIAEDPVLQRRISTIASAPSTLKELKNITDPVERHNFVINKVLQDYMGQGKQDVEFRESIITQLQRQGKEFKPEHIDNFINNPLSDPELLSDILDPASAVLADLTYTAPTVSSPFKGTLEVQGRGGSAADAPYTVRTDRLADPVTISGGENLPGESTSYTINSVGIDPTNGDILIPITYEEEGEPIFDPLTREQTGTRTSTSQQTLRIPGGDVNQADPLALEAFENLPVGQQALIQQRVNERNVRSDAEIQAEMERQQQDQMDREQQSTQPPASTEPEQQAQGATAAATTQQAQDTPAADETLDIQPIDQQEEEFDDDQPAQGAVPQSLNNAPGTTTTTSPDGGQLVSVSSLPQNQIDLAARATEVNQRFPVGGQSRTPEIAAAIETLRDPSATDAARSRAESVLQAEVDRGDRMEDVTNTESVPSNAVNYRGGVYVPSSQATQNPVSIPGRDGSYEYLGDRVTTPNPNEQLYRPMTAAQRERGETGMAGVSVPTFGQDVSRAEAAITEAIGNAARDLGLGSLDDRADEIGRSIANTLFGPSDFKRQTGEFVDDVAAGASELASDLRDNTGMNLRRAYDAVVDAAQTGGSALMDFLRGSGPTQEEVDRQRFDAARERQRRDEEAASAPLPQTEPVAIDPPTPSRGADTPTPITVEPQSPRQAQAEEQLRERLEAIESEQTPEYINELQNLVPEMNLVSTFEGYASEGPAATRANVPKGDDGKPHNNSGYTIGGLDISEHSLDDLPFLNRILNDDDFEKIKQLEGLKGKAAQDKLNELSEGGFDANLSYLTPEDIRLIEAETYRTKILPDLKNGLEKNNASISDFKNLPLSVRDAMNSVFFLSPSSGSPKATKLLAKAMNSGEKSDWEKLVKELDRFWDRSGKTQEKRVKDKNDGISQGHVNRMQASAAQIAKQYGISYTKS